MTPLKVSEQPSAAGLGVYLGPDSFTEYLVQDNELIRRTAFALSLIHISAAGRPALSSARNLLLILLRRRSATSRRGPEFPTPFLHAFPLFPPPMVCFCFLPKHTKKKKT